MSIDSSSRQEAAAGGLSLHMALARPDHWFKNIFMLPGAALAMVLANQVGFGTEMLYLAIGVVATCLIASANYTINEFLDAEFDRHHPVKKHRPSAAGLVTARFAYSQWAVLSVLGLAIAATLNLQFFLCAFALLIMGLAYNVRPFRTKDRIYLDVISESINNPLRFMLGWAAIVGNVLPPSSILLAYWMGGAYLMAVKRYAEYRFIGDPARAGKYRRSFQFYTEESLLVSAFFYALTSAFFLGVFLIKYRVEFLLAMPFLAMLFTWYLKIGMRADSVTQKPEHLYKERTFALYVTVLGLLVTVLFMTDMPWLNSLVDYHVLYSR